MVQENIRGSSTPNANALTGSYQETGFSGVSGLVAQLVRVAIMQTAGLGFESHTGPIQFFHLKSCIGSHMGL